MSALMLCDSSRTTALHALYWRRLEITSTDKHEWLLKSKLARIHLEYSVGIHNVNINPLLTSLNSNKQKDMERSTTGISRGTCFYTSGHQCDGMSGYTVIPSTYFVRSEDWNVGIFVSGDTRSGSRAYETPVSNSDRLLQYKDDQHWISTHPINLIEDSSSPHPENASPAGGVTKQAQPRWRFQPNWNEKWGTTSVAQFAH
ncbi:hypothetical protein BD410DRAFT_804115 [Rickenella mellea]|uniref:Uncharacterized protein n=1 Tax=Rickenella mellea TaxID=50990 RepID=A0A4Y7Q352_9AGAM|nr:hypothetical protein BD410DRAFT_804115 [Rickenella mellea]